MRHLSCKSYCMAAVACTASLCDMRHEESRHDTLDIFIIKRNDRQQTQRDYTHPAIPYPSKIAEHSSNRQRIARL